MKYLQQIHKTVIILSVSDISSAPYSDRVTMYGSNLRFSKVTRKDNGVYDCEVSGNGQFRESRVTLTVLGNWSLYVVYSDCVTS